MELLAEHDEAIVRFTLPSPSATDVPIAFQTAGNAELAKDYKVSPANLIIPAGQTTASLTISVLGDTVREDYEEIILTFASRLSNVSGDPLRLTLEYDRAGGGGPP